MKFYLTAKNYVRERGHSAKQKASASMRRNLLVIKRGLAIETQETKVMLNIYHQYTMGKASKDEMRQANKQFVNLMRGLGLGVLTVLPFSPITIPAIVKLGERFGINVLPSSFDFSQPEVEISTETEAEVIVYSETESTVNVDSASDATLSQVLDPQEDDLAKRD
ncbi:hypothetical protein [Alteromonas sp. a30]|uniref:hypothetical protein n=1 Tax=Alteromonas sp. a30 TaxID=2730917 RepID=UPI0022821CAD|nr:hypothetical protein [Alteromonas sp. a30]